MKNPLHEIAKLEAQKKITPHEIATQTAALLNSGIDVHQLDENGETAFNIAAPASPVIGRLLTNRWLDLSLKNLGSKKINEVSGSHNSTLAQYIAKWSNADEIEQQLDAAIKAGMNIAVQNSSGWTPLHASCAMISRLHAVKAFSNRYSVLQRNLKTLESYSTKYFESPETIIYAENLTASDIAKARLFYGKTLAQNFKKDFEDYINYLNK